MDGEEDKSGAEQPAGDSELPPKERPVPDPRLHSIEKAGLNPDRRLISIVQEGERTDLETPAASESSSDDATAEE